MKNFISLLYIGLLLLSISAQAQISEQVNFSLNEVEIIQTNNYDRVYLKDGTLLTGESYVGQPQLPVAQVNILLPKGATATNVSITGSQQTQILGNFNIYPVQIPRTLGNNIKIPFVESKPTIYASNNSFPQNPLLSYSTHIYREYSYAEINFIPFSYLAQSGQLYLLSSLNINISYSTNFNTEPISLPSTEHGDELAYRFW